MAEMEGAVSVWPSDTNQHIVVGHTACTGVGLRLKLIIRTISKNDRWAY